MADLYRSQDHAHPDMLKLDSTSSSQTIEADRGRVRQILNNLVTNALEALEGVSQPHARDHDASSSSAAMPRTPW